MDSILGEPMKLRSQYGTSVPVLILNVAAIRLICNLFIYKLTG